MGMLDILLGKKGEAATRARPARPAPASSEFVASQLSPGSGSSQSVRKDLLKVVLRETLLRNGIPQAWIGADMLRTSNPKREQGLHVRFLVRRWEPKLMLHGPAIEQEFAHRLVLMDPTATDWMMGFSWQFALEDSTACPPMPHPGTWTAPPVQAQEPAAPPETKPGDIIEGPVVIPKPLDEVRADLEQLMALRDADMKRHAAATPDAFAETRPATL